MNRKHRAERDTLQIALRAVVAEVGTVPIPGIVNSTIPPNFGIVREELIPSQGVVEKNWNYRSVVPKNSISFHHS